MLNIALLDFNLLRPLIMVAMFVVLLALPIRLSKVALIRLAFMLWMIGGCMLAIVGLTRLLDPAVHLSTMVLAIALFVSLAVGYGKGKFVLSKTSARNLDRLAQMETPQRPLHVYGIRSWIVIALMLLLSVSLTLLHVDPFWRGCVNLTVGFALCISSLAYLKALRNPEALSI
jgi:hypothetical protein